MFVSSKSAEQSLGLIESLIQGESDEKQNNHKHWNYYRNFDDRLRCRTRFRKAW